MSIKPVRVTRFNLCVCCNKETRWRIRFNYTPTDYDYVKLCKDCQTGKTINDPVFIDQALRYWSVFAPLHYGEPMTLEEMSEKYSNNKK
jgi:hypothetical protein